MSATATDVFDNSAFATPEAELDVVPKDSPDKLFSYQGRIGVMRYNARLIQISFFMGLAALGIFGSLATENDIVIAVGGIVSVVLLLVCVWVMTYQTIKRMHDLGLSGWYQLIGAIPLIGAFWILYYMLKPGKDEGNKFGNRRAATTVDKVFAVLGLIVWVPLVLLSAVPEELLATWALYFM